jgi:hypothetical protein
MILAKDKSEEEAMKWLIRSVHLYPMNWGCWLEMTALIGQVEDVRAFSQTSTAGRVQVVHKWDRVLTLI